MFATTAAELLLAFREDVDDYSSYEPGNDVACLWKDREIYRYMTRACDALAKETDGLFKLVRLSYSADVPTVTLPRHVLHIRSVRDLTQERDLEQFNANTTGFGMTEDYGMRISGRNAMFEGSGHPSAYVRDYETKALRLVPIPNADGQLELQCTVTLQAALSGGETLPFLDAEDQELLLEYMKYLAYRKQDAETEDLVRSNRAKQAYDEHVKDRKSALANYRRSPGTVRAEY